MNEKPRKLFFVVNIALIAFLLLGVYAGSYYLLVEPTGIAETSPVIESVEADYRFAAAFARPLFWPANQVDRLLRPDLWNPAKWAGTSSQQNGPLY